MNGREPGRVRCLTHAPLRTQTPEHVCVVKAFPTCHCAPPKTTARPELLVGCLNGDIVLVHPLSKGTVLKQFNKLVPAAAMWCLAFLLLALLLCMLEVSVR